MEYGQTHLLSWERIQEFYLPDGHCCSSIAVNETLGQIMFACKKNGLLHYRWSEESGLVFADKPKRVTFTRSNPKLISYAGDGQYLVLDHRHLVSQRLCHGNGKPQAECVHHHLIKSRRQQDRRKNRSKPPAAQGDDILEYCFHSANVGNVISMAVDRSNNSIYLLYQDALMQHSYENLHRAENFKLCDTNASLISSMASVRCCRKFIYLLTSAGNIKIRYNPFSADKRLKLLWHQLGSNALEIGRSNAGGGFDNLIKPSENDTKSKQRTRFESIDSISDSDSDSSDTKSFASPAELIDRRRTRVRRVTGAASNEFYDDLDKMLHKSTLYLALDHNRNLLIATTNSPLLYVIWHDHRADLSGKGWRDNWMEDCVINLAEFASKRRGFALDESVNVSRPFTPGPITIVSQQAMKAAFVYMADQFQPNWILVLRYTTESGIFRLPQQY